jgi:hypothetical protein
MHHSSFWKVRVAFPLAALLIAAELALFGAAPDSLAKSTTANCSRTSVGKTALTDLGTGTYHGFPGGLYPNGMNHLPSAYRDVGVSDASFVRPLSATGAPDPQGKIGLLSIGMSNTLLEFASFAQVAKADPAVNHSLVFVNGAQAGADATIASQSTSPYWSSVSQALASDGVAPAQVQVVWLKEAIIDETRPFPTDATALQNDLRSIVGILHTKYPNLRLVYLESRTYAGYATIPLNPEPFAYESGFAVKWLIQQDITTTQQERPWLAWGPYFWTNGLAGRSDGFEWACGDVRSDGTHPSPTGSAVLAQMLLTFFKSSPTTRGWFLATTSPGPSPAPTPTPTKG